MSEHVGIAGSGAIACGLAATAARHGEVVLWARSASSRDRARASVDAICGRLSGEVNASHVTVTMDIHDLAHCSYIVEAVAAQDWAGKVGKGTSVNWPNGIGAKGNEGVAAFVGRLPNSIGYVEYAYVKQNKLSYALLQNSAGNFVAPDDKAFKAAAAGADWAKSFYQILTQQKGKDAWPITGATFILMHKKLRLWKHVSATRPRQSADVIRVGVRDEQPLHVRRLEAEVRQLLRHRVDRLRRADMHPGAFETHAVQAAGLGGA